MKDEKSQIKIEDWLFKGLVFAIPFIGYFLAFRYEEGFCSVFQIPSSLISLSLINIFIGIGALVGILFLLYGVVDLIIRFLPKRENPIFDSLRVLLPGFLLLIVYLVLFGKFWQEWVWILSTFLFLCFLEFIFPLFTFPKEKTYFEKLKAQQRSDTKEAAQQLRKMEGVLLLGIPWRVIYKIFLLSLGLLYLSLFSYAVGRSIALKQKEFLVFYDSQPMVILRIYDDTIISAPFNKTTKEVEKKFIVYKVGEEPRFIFNLEKIGPLRSVNR